MLKYHRDGDANNYDATYAIYKPFVFGWRLENWKIFINED